jgi:hypothetical protein
MENSDNTRSAPQMIVLGYPVGAIEWMQAYPDPQNPGPITQAVSTKLMVGTPRDSGLNEYSVYVAGTVWQSTGRDVGVAAFQYLNGVPQWVYTSDQEVADDEDVFDAVTNDGGDVYVTGTRFVAGNIRYRTIKLNPSVLNPPPPPLDRYAWSAEYDTTGVDKPFSIKLIPLSGGEPRLEDLYVTGITANGPTGSTAYDYVTFRYLQTP